MKSMKKVTLFATAAILALGIVGCSKDSGDSKAANTASANSKKLL